MGQYGTPDQTYKRDSVAMDHLTEEREISDRVYRDSSSIGITALPTGWPEEAADQRRGQYMVSCQKPLMDVGGAQRHDSNKETYSRKGVCVPRSAVLPSRC